MLSRKASPLRIYVFYSYLSLCMNMVHPVTPTLVHELGFSSLLYSSLSSTLALTNFLCAPVWGYYSDRHGRRPVLLVGTVMYACSQFLFSRATTVPVLLIARLCGGIGRLCECRRGQHGQAERQCHEQTQYSFLHVGLLQRMCSHFSVMRGRADGQPRLPVKNPCIFTDFLYDGIIHRTLTCDARVFCVFRGIL